MKNQVLTPSRMPFLHAGLRLVLSCSVDGPSRASWWVAEFGGEEPAGRLVEGSGCHLVVVRVAVAKKRSLAMTWL